MAGEEKPLQVRVNETHSGGNAHPRDLWQFELQDSSTIALERGYSGQNLDYRYFVIELGASN